MVDHAGDRISELDQLKSHFGPGRSRQKRAALRALRGTTLARPADLLRYHEVLCFLRAFPDDAAMMREAEDELSRFAGRVESCREAHSGALPEAIDNSGIVGTVYRYPYGFPMACWLLDRFGPAVEVDWDEYESRDEDALASVLVPLVGWVETAALDDELLPSREWFDRTRGRRASGTLRRLIGLLRRTNLPIEVQESLFNSLNLSIRWDLRDCAGSRTLLRTMPAKPFFHRGPMRGRTADLRREIARALPRVPPCPVARGRAWIDSVRCALSVRERELYPVALANEREVYELPVGRGIRVLLYGMRPERRLPVETDYGAFVVKNGMPIGYGVAALLLDRVEIAVNIFPTFRQGESSFVFEQFARLFRHQFGARAFLVERYQLGHENDEGLDAGSFWFYHKLGFRSVDRRVRALAEEEAARLAREPSARSSRRMLRRLARSNVILNLDRSRSETPRSISLTAVGLAVTRMVEDRFAGDRQRAERVCSRELAGILGIAGLGRWPEEERAAFRRLSPLGVLLPGLREWSAADRGALARILRSKGSAQEADYARRVMRHVRLRSALESFGG